MQKDILELSLNNINEDKMWNSFKIILLYTRNLKIKISIHTYMYEKKNIVIPQYIQQNVIVTYPLYEQEQKVILISSPMLNQNTVIMLLGINQIKVLQKQIQYNAFE